MPERIRVGIERCAENAPAVDQLLATWLKDDAHQGRRIVGLRELDPLPRNFKLVLREHAIARIRAPIRQQIQTRYRRIAEKLLKRFAVRLEVECLIGAIVRARTLTGSLTTLTRSDIRLGVLDIDDDSIMLKNQKWFSVCISLPLAKAEAGPTPKRRRFTQAPPPPPTVRGFFGPLEPKASPAADLASTYGARRTPGVKSNKLSAAIEWLLTTYPNGVPADRKNDVLVADMKAETDIEISVKTLRRAMVKIAERSQGQIADKAVK